MSLAETLEKKGEVRGEARGKEIGRIESKNEIAVKMLKKGLDIQLISELSGLSIEEIEKLNLKS